MKRLSILVAPRLLGVVSPLDVDRAGAPVVLLAAHVVAALDQQNPLARRGEMIDERAAACARPDDDHVVVRHAGVSMNPQLKMQRTLRGWCSLAQRTPRRPRVRTNSS